MAGGVLTQLGFTTEFFTSVPGDRMPSSSEWQRDDGIWIDLHRELIGAQAPAEIVWEVLWSNTVAMDLRGVDTTVLSVPGRALHITLHAAQHGKSALHPLRDLRLALEKVDEETWRQALVIAREIDATSAMSAGLRLVPEGSRLAESLGLPAPSYVDDVLRATSGSKAAFNIQTFSSLPGVSAKLRFALRKAFPPISFMRNRSPLARRGSWGLVVAYLARPFVVLWGFAMGLRPWLEARRATKSSDEPRHSG